jgi:trimeric autotransporter adhesin
MLAACGDNDPASEVDPTIPELLGSPQSVSASDGTSADVVFVRWSPVKGAASYRVYRDGAALADVANHAFDDTTASAPTTTAPQLTASAGTYVDRVQLDWTPFVSADGAAHEYSVTALRGSEESDPSTSDSGFRAAYRLLGYEISNNAGAAFTIMVPASTLTYADVDAPAGVIVPGNVSATDGTYSSYVEVHLTGTSVTHGAAVAYVVRAVSTGENVDSATVDGYRGIGSPSYECFRHDFDELGIPHRAATGVAATDFVEYAVAAGRLYAYDCTISAAGAPSATTKPDTGWRAARQNETPRANTWVIDGPSSAPAIDAVAFASDATYIGGDFTYVGPPTGAFAALDATTGAASLRPARVYAPQRDFYPWGVATAVEDGTGGWYIGGDFTSISGVPQARLAHLNAAGELDRTFAPIILDGQVMGIAVVGNKVYAAGFFFNVDWEPRQGFAVFDATTGALGPFSPALDVQVENQPAFVNSLHYKAGVLFVGGSFTSIAGQPRYGLAAIDVATDTVTSWNPLADSSGISIRAASGNTLYVLGGFSEIGGQQRAQLAAIDMTTAAATAFAPPALDSLGRVWALATNGTAVFIVGSFSTVGGQPRAGVAALDASTGALLPFQAPAPEELSSFTFTAVAATSNKVFVAGRFDKLGVETRHRLAALDASTGALLPWAPVAPPRNINLLTLSNNTLYVGGAFSSVGGRAQCCVAALDSATGGLTSWTSGITSLWATALAVNGGSLYASGLLTFDDSQPFQHFVQLDRTTGAQLASSYDAVASELLVAGGVLFVAGDQLLRAIDLGTGNVTSWDPAPNGPVRHIALDGTTLYVAGAFTNIGGQARNGLAAMDTTSALPLSWNPGASVSDMSIVGSRLYVAGAFATIAGQPRAGLASFELNSGALSPWNPNTGASVSASIDTFAIVASVAYAVGFEPGDASPEYIGAVDTITGLRVLWHPSWLGTTYKMVANGTSMVAIGSLQQVSGYPRTGIAIFDP